MMPTPKWRQEFEKYLLSIPSYYYPSMKNGTCTFHVGSLLCSYEAIWCSERGPRTYGREFKLSNFELLQKAEATSEWASLLISFRLQSKMETDRIQAAMKQAKESASTTNLVCVVWVKIMSYEAHQRYQSRTTNAGCCHNEKLPSALGQLNSKASRSRERSVIANTFA
jgi:hypothetical protein